MAVSEPWGGPDVPVLSAVQTSQPMEKSDADLSLCEREDGREALACRVPVSIREMTAKSTDEGAVQRKELPPNHAGFSQSRLAPISKRDIEFPCTSLGARDHCENDRSVVGLKFGA